MRMTKLIHPLVLLAIICMFMSFKYTWLQFIYPILLVSILFIKYRETKKHLIHKNIVQWRTYRYLTIWGTFIFFILYFINRFSTHDKNLNIPFQAIILLMFILVFGNLAPKLPYNTSVGLRLPWITSTEKTWKYAHTMLGYCTIPCLIYMFICLLSNDNELYMLGFLAWLLIPSILSYRFDRKARSTYEKQTIKS